MLEVIKGSYFHMIWKFEWEHTVRGKLEWVCYLWRRSTEPPDKNNRWILTLCSKEKVSGSTTAKWTQAELPVDFDINKDVLERMVEGTKNSRSPLKRESIIRVSIEGDDQKLKQMFLAGELPFLTAYNGPRRQAPENTLNPFIYGT